MFSHVPEVYLTEAEACKLLSISLPTMRRWRRDGRGPEYFRVGGVIRYSRHALELFIANHTVKAA